MENQNSTPASNTTFIVAREALVNIVNSFSASDLGKVSQMMAVAMSQSIPQQAIETEPVAVERVRTVRQHIKRKSGLRPFIDQILLTDTNHHGRLKMDEILEALRAISCPHLLRDDKGSLRLIRNIVGKNSKNYHRHADETYSIRQPMKGMHR